jgi:hypothetical protein
MRHLIEREKNFLVLILNFHTYGNLWIRPYNYSGHSTLKHFDMDEHIFNFYKTMEKEILELCPAAQVGNAVKTVEYKAFGEASDWSLGEHKIVSYSPELGYSDPQYDDFFIARDIINKALNENFLVINRMMSKAKYQLDDIVYYLTDENQLVIDLNNQTLGKVFNGKFRFKVSDLRFFEGIENVLLEQEGYLQEKLSYKVVYLDDDVMLQENNPKVIKELYEDQYLEIEFLQLNYLSKMRLIIEMNSKINKLRDVNFSLSIMKNDIYEIQSFKFSQTFAYSQFWKYCFFIVLYVNAIVIFIIFIYKCFFPDDLFNSRKNDLIESEKKIKQEQKENYRGSATGNMN